MKRDLLLHYHECLSGMRVTNNNELGDLRNTKTFIDFSLVVI